MINRKDFLKGILTVPFLGGWFVKTVLTRGEKKKYLLNKFSIAGFQFYEGPEIILKLKAGEALQLMAEPDNIHDDYAVKTLYKKIHIGYVPRSDNHAISRLIRQGMHLEGKIEKACPQEVPWQMLKVSV